MYSTHCNSKLLRYLSIYLSLQEKTQSRKTCWKRAGLPYFRRPFKCACKAFFTSGSVHNPIIVVSYATSYRHFHLQQDIFTPINRQLQVPSNSRKIGTRRQVYRHYNWLVSSTVPDCNCKFTMAPTKILYPACCYDQQGLITPATSGTIRQHLRL